MIARMHCSLAIVTVLGILSLAPASAAQGVPEANNVGLPLNGVFDGSEFANVQLNNRNLHIEIPLWSTKGRGLGVAFKYVYDHKKWYFDTFCDHQGMCHDHVEGGGKAHPCGTF